MSDEKLSWSDRIRTTGSFASAIALLFAVATYIGIKPEKKKQIEWQYQSVSTLVNRTGIGNNIEVMLGPRKLEQVTAVTAKLSNTGEIPVDATEVKDGMMVGPR
jgi:hypothetical protein